MSVSIRGKEYLTVAERIGAIHSARPDAVEVLTDIHTFSPPLVIVRAVVRVHTEKGVREYNGHAYEMMDNGQINSTSALENCETSAIGRALAAAGYGGTEYASANEVENAIHQQSAPAAQAPAPSGNRPNKYKGICGKCEQEVAAEAGYSQKIGEKWVTLHHDCPAGGPPLTPPPMPKKAPQATATQETPCTPTQYASLLGCLKRTDLTPDLFEQAAFLLDNPTVILNGDTQTAFARAGYPVVNVPSRIDADQFKAAVTKHLAAPPILTQEEEDLELPF